MDFCFLTRNAFFCQLIYICGHVRPNKMGGNKVACGLDAGMAKRMHVLENGLLEGRRNQGVENVHGNITKKGKGICDGNGGDGEGWGFFEGKDGRICLLGSGHV